MFFKEFLRFLFGGLGVGNGSGLVFGQGLRQATILVWTMLHIALIGTADNMSTGVFRTCSALVVCETLA